MHDGLGLCIAVGVWLRLDDDWERTAGIARLLASFAWVEAPLNGLFLVFADEAERQRLIGVVRGCSPFELVGGYFDPRRDGAGYSLRTIAEFQGGLRVDVLILREVDIGGVRYPMEDLKVRMSGQSRPARLWRDEVAPGEAPPDFLLAHLDVSKVEPALWARTLECGTYSCPLTLRG